MAVQVLVDEPAIDREFTYLLPPEMASGRVPVAVGTVVRVTLNRRRLRGWVTALDVPLPEGREVVPINGVSSVGPPPDVVELAGWAAWRWAGTRAHFLRIASSERNVAGLPPATPPRRPVPSSDYDTDGKPQMQVESRQQAGAKPTEPRSGNDSAVLRIDPQESLRRVFDGDTELPTVLRLGPCADEWPLLAEALTRGRLLALVPTVAWAARLAGRLRQASVSTALTPRDWAGAATAHAVVGTRSAAWAPCGRLDTVVVLDEHDEAYQSEAAPTWNGRDVAVERARRDGAHCLLVGPMPSPDARLLAHRSDAAADPTVITAQRQAEREGRPAVTAPPRQAEREAWPRVQIADRRQDDPAMGEWCGEALTELLRSDRTVVCVLNRTGRARLAYCASCGELACSRQSGRPLRLEKQQFVDPDTGETRPAVCEACGAAKFRRARVGVKGVAEEMERLARRPVIQVVGNAAAVPVVSDTQRMGTGARARAGKRSGQRSGDRQARMPRQAEQSALYIGTEAVLHRVPSADAVAFLDFDQELTAPRYRAAEEAFALLVRAARLVGPRSGGGRILVQTRLPGHPVLAAAANADPTAWLRSESERREQMRQPPAVPWVLISGAAAEQFVERLSTWPDASALDIAGPADGIWRVRADRRDTLLDALAATERPPGRLRVAVDPMRA